MQDALWLFLTLNRDGLSLPRLANGLLHLPLLNLSNLPIPVLLEVLIGNLAIGVGHLDGLMDTAVVVFVSMALMHILILILPLVSFVLSALGVSPLMDLVDAAGFVVALGGLVVSVVLFPKGFPV